jgi:uncharacterized protein (TIGR02118 family)
VIAVYSLVVLAARPPEWTHDQFITWWRGEHADVTRVLPGLRRWRHVAVDRALDPRSDGWDGISVLTFDSADDLDRALASPQWAAAVAHVGAMRGRRIAVAGEEAELFAAALG